MINRLAVMPLYFCVTTTVNAMELPDPTVVGGNFIAAASMKIIPETPVIGMLGVGIGAYPGAFKRSQTENISISSAYVEQVGSIATGKAVGTSLSAMGSGKTSKFILQHAGSWAGEHGYDALLERSGKLTESSIGGLQAELTPSNNITGIKNGIQQYILMKSEPDASISLRKSSSPQLGNSSDRQLIGRVPGDGGRHNGDRLIGRVPGTNGGDQFLNGLGSAVLGGAINGLLGGSAQPSRGLSGRCGPGMHAPEIDTPNPRSCY